MNWVSDSFWLEVEVLKSSRGWLKDCQR